MKRGIPLLVLKEAKMANGIVEALQALTQALVQSNENVKILSSKVDALGEKVNNQENTGGSQ